MPDMDNHREGNPMMTMLARMFWWLDSIILSLGSKINSILSLGSKINSLIILSGLLLLGSNNPFEILFEPTHPSNYLKMLFYCGIVACYYLMSELKYEIAQRLCVVAVVALTSHHLWHVIILMPVPFLFFFFFSVLSISFLLSLLPHIIFVSDVMLSSVGKNSKRMNRYLKWLEIMLLFDSYGRFELWLKQSSEPADYLKVICYGLFAILLCCLGMLNHPCISGLVFLSLSGYLLWSFATPLPFWSRVCFVGVFDLLLAGIATAYEYHHVWMGYCHGWMEGNKERRKRGE